MTSPMLVTMAEAPPKVNARGLSIVPLGERLIRREHLSQTIGVQFKCQFLLGRGTND
jgi:hypothetical protein